MTNHEMRVLDAMDRYGGGFVQALAAAWRKADQENSRKLRLAFPQYWDKYAQAAADDAARETANVNAAAQ